MRTIHEQIDHIMQHNPEKMHKIIHHLEEDYGEEILGYFFCHIHSKEMYDKAVSYIKNFNGSKGAHWLPEIIKNKSMINFADKEYTLWDYSYMANKIYSHIGDLLMEENILKYAKRLLEDSDYPGNPSERAFHDAIKMIDYFESGA